MSLEPCPDPQHQGQTCSHEIREADDLTPPMSPEERFAGRILGDSPPPTSHPSLHQGSVDSLQMSQANPALPRVVISPSCPELPLPRLSPEPPSPTIHLTPIRPPTPRLVPPPHHRSAPTYNFNSILAELPNDEHYPDPHHEPEQPPQPRERPRTIRQRLRRFFSAQGRQQRKEAGIVFRMISSLVQIAIITTILSLSATKFRSGITPYNREWDSCARPLGTWSALWAARVTLGLFMGVWEFFREREKVRRAAIQTPRRRDTESRGNRRSSNTPSAAGEARRSRQQNPRRSSRRTSSSTGAAGPSQARLSVPRTASTPAAAPAMAVAGALAAGGLTSPPRPSARVHQSPRHSSTMPSRVPEPSYSSQRTPPTPPQRPLFGDAMFSRLETFLTMLALSHFVTNQIFLYSSVETCRISAPHIWWLAFGIACLGYMVVLEIVLIALVVFVFGPLLLLTLNLIMICLGRPVDARGNVQIRAEIPKLDQKYVNQIPLVVFIPGEEKEEEPAKDEHAYPPKPAQNSSSTSGKNASPSTNATPSAAKPKASRFRFLKRKEKSGKGSPGPSKSPDTEQADHEPSNAEDPWEAQFERGEHPFVKLEGNRATCAICLCDFVEPKKRNQPAGGDQQEGEDTVGVAGPSTSARPLSSISTISASTRPVSQNVDSSRPSSIKGEETDTENPQGGPSKPTEDTAKSIKSKATKKSRKDKEAEKKKKAEEEENDGVGTPGEPLRLLACGHVFHRQCLDPWLLDVSGRCPVCQRKVLIGGMPRTSEEERER